MAVNRKKEEQGGFLLWIAISVFIFLTVAGPIHSYRKHGKDDFWVSILVPPYGWYRAIEMFWCKNQE